MGMPANQPYVQRQSDDPYLKTVARALMTTADVRQSGSDYHRLDYSDVLTVAATENTPFSTRLGRFEGARDIKHYWLEQYLPDTGTVTPLAETADPGLNGVHVPTRFENAMMKIGRKFQITDEMDIIARAGGLIAVGPDEFGRQLAMHLTLMIRDQEKAILEAVYDDGGTGNPRQMKGLLGDYKNGNENGWISGESDTAFDFAGAQITAANIDAILNQEMRQISNLFAGPLPTTLYVPSNVLRPLAQATQSKIQVTVPWEQLASAPHMTLGSAVGKWYSDFGVLNIVYHPLLTAATASGASTQAKLNSRMLLVYEPGIRMVDYMGYGGIHVEARAKTDPTETRVITQFLSLEVRYLKSHGNIRNFWVDPTL